MSFRFLPLAFSILDLKFECQPEYKTGKSKQLCKREGSRALKVTPSLHCISLKKEMKLGDFKPVNDVILIHRYQDMQVMRSNPSKQIDDDEFIVNKAYQCEIILTNVCPVNKRVTLSY